MSSAAHEHRSSQQIGIEHKGFFGVPQQQPLMHPEARPLSPARLTCLQLGFKMVPAICRQVPSYKAAVITGREQSPTFM